MFINANSELICVDCKHFDCYPNDGICISCRDYGLFEEESEK
jgi:hypothetical protein